MLLSMDDLTEAYINVASIINKANGMKTEDIEDKPPSPWMGEPDLVKRLTLGKAGEEFNELGKILARCSIQGVNECEPVTGKPNVQELEEEVGDAYAALGQLIKRLNLDQGHINDRMFKKGRYLGAWLDMAKRAS